MDAFELKPKNRLLRSAPTQSSKQHYPFNCWWVAATTEEVTSKPISRWLLEQRVVLFRTGDGTVTALEDRCAHRWAPLSQGRLIGDEIACPYHGFRYNARGVCTHVPTQSHVPAALKVRSYPAREYGPFVWIWMGDSKRADPAHLPSISWSNDPAYSRFRGYMEVRCNYIAIQENLMDDAHFNYLHCPADIDWHQSPALWPLPDDVEVTDRSVTTVMNVPPGPGKAGVRGRCTSTPPASYFAEWEVEDPARETRGRYGIRGVYGMTPMSPNRCHWWWAYILDLEDQASHAFQANLTVILKQDKDVLEAIQMTIDQDVRGDNAPEVLVVADRSMSAVRRILRKMLEADSQ